MKLTNFLFNRFLIVRITIMLNTIEVIIQKKKENTYSFVYKISHVSPFHFPVYE